MKLPPHTPDPGDGWYKLTFGEYAGWWVDIYNADVITYGDDTGVDVIFAEDEEAFLPENPRFSMEDDDDF